ncbi:hypothetical protein NDU88_003732 [Pleurodeles waltl]|uniref:Uncharacterized protein n=1 Tax=Pleurodeles waltl TaxID=8319 RepID=A0AAV7WT98_PLEWA|nr:hypothetical protein NDU88_003732 [Pleurodeles waltl]
MDVGVLHDNGVLESSFCVDQQPLSQFLCRARERGCAIQGAVPLSCHAAVGDAGHRELLPRPEPVSVFRRVLDETTRRRDCEAARSSHPRRILGRGFPTSELSCRRSCRAPGAAAGAGIGA